MPDEPTSLIEAPCGCSMTWNRALNMSSHVYCARDRDYALSPRTSIVRQLTEPQSSVEVGTPGKDGCVKVYFDADDPTEAKKKVDAALEVRAYLLAQGKKEEPKP